MSVMYLLILFESDSGKWICDCLVWAIRSGQYDDKYTPSVRVLFDDHPLRNLRKVTGWSDEKVMEEKNQ